MKPNVAEFQGVTWTFRVLDNSPRSTTELNRGIRFIGGVKSISHDMETSITTIRIDAMKHASHIKPWHIGNVISGIFDGSVPVRSDADMDALLTRINTM